LRISDDEIREKLEPAQLKFQRERGTDIAIFSPRASAMGHHVGNAATSVAWSQICNDMIHASATCIPGISSGFAITPIAGRASGQLYSRARALRQ